MNIQTVKNGQISELLHHTKRKHKEMLKSPPDWVIVLIRDFYPDSHEDGELLLPFDTFNALAREFMRQRKNEKQNDARRMDTRTFEQLERQRNPHVIGDARNDCALLEDYALVRDAISKLSPTLQRRIKMKYYAGMMDYEIAAVEGCSSQAVGQSIKVAKKKIVKLLGDAF